MRRTLAMAGLAIGLAALVLQFAITIPASMGAGRSPLLSVIFYFSFFTILTNGAAVLVYMASLTGRLPALATSRARASVASALVLVSGFYHLVLAHLWQPEGLFWICDVLLHYLTPLLFMVWFVAFGRSGTLTLRDVPAMLALPMLYLVYVMIRGAILGEYPYPVLAASELGYVQVGINVLGLLLLLAALNAAAVGIDRFRPDTQAR